MTAWVDDLGLGDEPAAFELTEIGEVLASGYRTLTSAEAAVVLSVSRARVNQVAAEGQLVGVRVDEGVTSAWLFDLDDVLAYAAWRAAGGRRPSARAPRFEPHVPAGPLLAHIAARGGRAAVGVRQHSPEEKALDRALVSGRLTVWQADHLAVTLLGLTPLELWGSDYLTA